MCLDLQHNPKLIISNLYTVCAQAYIATVLNHLTCMKSIYIYWLNFSLDVWSYVCMQMTRYCGNLVWHSLPPAQSSCYPMAAIIVLIYWLWEFPLHRNIVQLYEARYWDTLKLKCVNHFIIITLHFIWISILRMVFYSDLMRVVFDKLKTLALMYATDWGIQNALSWECRFECGCIMAQDSSTATPFPTPILSAPMGPLLR